MTLTLDPPPHDRVGRSRELRPPRFRLAIERREDAGAVDSLVDAAFGPGRFAKTAERLREGVTRRTDLSWCVWGPGGLVGSVRTWPLAVGASSGVFLGPIAVAADRRRRGLGALLVERVCEAALDAGDGYIFLIGAGSFFEPLGFAPVMAGQVRLPGPVDPRRLFWRPLGSASPEALEGQVASPRLPRHAHRVSA